MNIFSRYLIFISCLLSFLLLDENNARAGGAVAKVEQRQAIIEQQKAMIEQQILQQRALQERQMMERALQQRAMQKQVLQRQIEERTLQQRAYQQAVEQKTAYQMQALGAVKQRTMQEQAAAQMIMGQKVQEANAIKSNYQQAAAQQQMLAAQYAASQQALDQGMRQTSADYANQQRSLSEINYHSIDSLAQPADIVNMSEIWDELKISSEVWSLMMDQAPKEQVVEEYIKWYDQQGIRIRKPIEYYVQLIDGISKENENLLKNSFKDVLKFVAIIEYDFDNGQDKDSLAKRILGPDGYQTNRKRLGLTSSQ